MANSNSVSSEITLEESEALKQFKQRIPDLLEKFNAYKSHDIWLRRWLIAREMCIPKAEEMLRKSVQWRVDHQIDAIMDWKAPDSIDQLFPVKATGFDKDGCIITTVAFGKWDVRKVVSLGLKNEFLRYVDQVFEQAMRFMEFKSTEENILTQFVIILDFEEFSLRQLASRETIETIAEVIRRFEGNHPETLKAAWVVNAPKIFEILFTLIKPLMTARTISKVRVFGSKTEQWRRSLLENIEPDQLPSQFGGANTSCKNYKVEYGFDIFPVYETFEADEMVAVTVEAGEKKFVEFGLSKGSGTSGRLTTILDSVFCMNLTIDGSPGLNKGHEEMEVLFSCSRADSHLHLQKGSIVAEERGTYTIVFDNSFSRFRRKNVFYAARVNANSQKIV